jgi:hypothetical protein
MLHALLVRSLNPERPQKQSLVDTLCHLVHEGDNGRRLQPIPFLVVTDVRPPLGHKPQSLERLVGDGLRFSKPNTGPNLAPEFVKYLPTTVLYNRGDTTTLQ